MARLVEGDSALFSDLMIGVLALTGSFEEHAAIVERLGARTRQVRKPEELDGLDGVIFPGGETTAMGIVDDGSVLFGELRRRIDSGMPVYGTCAGLILLADKAIGTKKGGQALVGGLKVTVCRNYFGAQVSSFEVPLISADDKETFNAVFIRAPAILELEGEGQPGGPVALATIDVPPSASASPAVMDFKGGANSENHRVCVAARQGNILATAFHPELTQDTRWHSKFLHICRDNAKAAKAP